MTQVTRRYFHFPRATDGRTWIRRKLEPAVASGFQHALRLFRFLAYEVRRRLQGDVVERQLTDSLESILKRLGPLDEDLLIRARDDMKLAIRSRVRWRRDGLRELCNIFSGIESPAIPCRPDLRPGAGSGGRMRILYVCGMAPSMRHGGGLRLFDILMELSQRHDVDLFCGFQLDDDDESIQALAPHLKNIRLVSYQQFNFGRLYAWFCERNLVPGFYDVIQFEYPASAKLMSGAQPWGRRCGFTLMECIAKRDLIDYQNLVSRGSGNARVTKLLQFVESVGLETEAVRRGDFSIAVTDADADFIAAIAGPRPDVIPTGISDAAVFNRLKECGVDPDPGTIMFLGSYQHPPNVEAVIWYLENIHPRVLRNMPEARFLIVGAGGTSAFETFAARDRSITIVGEVSDIVPAIAGAQVCIAPLISGAGIRGKINQYTAVGRPVVTTSIGAAGLPYKDGESIFVADDPSVFADRIIALLADPFLRKSMAELGQKLASAHFGWGPIMSRLESIYAR